MSSQFFSGSKVNLMDMLTAREQRAATQKELLAASCQEVLLSATMNIPGPVKNSPGLEEVFLQVTEKVEDVLADITHSVNLYRNEKTGPEYYLMAPLTKEELKKRMVAIEETHPYGRLVDLDVLWLENGVLHSISRQDLGEPSRSCLICQENAKACGRARKHTVAEMQAKIIEIVEKGRLEEND